MQGMKVSLGININTLIVYCKAYYWGRKYQRGH